MPDGSLKMEGNGKVKITLEIHGATYTAEEPRDDINAGALQELFSRLMVVASYPPTVIADAEGGRWECQYKLEGEI